jgi:hypothetical protein
MNYDSLKQFLDRHEEFEKNLQGNLHSDKNVFLFGISGAGKSTFLCRFLSSMSDDDFFNTVISRDSEINETINVDGVVISSKKVTTTLVPKRYELRNRGSYIYDIPGFGDNNKITENVIQLMYHCLLSKVIPSKFIIVVSALSIYTHERKSYLETEYTNKLVEMFGDEFFKKFILENSLFVITQIDMVSEKAIEIASVESMIINLIDGAIERGKMQFALFLTAMKRNHFVINYKNWNKKEFVRVMKQKNGSLMSSVNYKVKSSCLVDQTIANLEVMTKKFLERMEQQKKVIKELKDKEVNMSSVHNKNRRIILKLENDKKARETLLESKTKEVQSFSNDLKLLTDDLKVIESQIESRRICRGAIRESIQKIGLVKQRSYCSVKCVGLVTSEKVLIAANLLSHNSRNIIITKVPITFSFKSVNDSKMFNNEKTGVLYNDAGFSTNESTFKCSIGKLRGTHTVIDVEYSSKFFVTVIEDTNISSMNVDKIMVAIESSKDLQFKKDDKIRQISRLKSSNEENNKEIKDCQAALSSIKKKIENAETRHGELIKKAFVLKSEFDENSTTVNELVNEIQSCLFFEMCGKLSETFDLYDLKTNLSTKIEQSKKSLMRKVDQIIPHPKFNLF